MGLIKRNQLEEKGTLMIERKAAPLHKPKLETKPMLAALAAGATSAEGLSQVRNEAERIIQEAMAEADGVREEARAAGKEEGRAEATSQIAEAMETMNQAIKERKQIVKDAEGEILRLSLKVAEQIIRSEVSLHRDVCLNIVAEAIARVSDREQIIIKVNREDAEYLKRYKDRLTSMLDGVKSFSIIEDASVEPGGCVIETNLGFIDARISTKIKSIEEALKKVSAEEERV